MVPTILCGKADHAIAEFALLESPKALTETQFELGTLPIAGVSSSEKG
jgi:hypothetical protein